MELEHIHADALELYENLNGKFEYEKLSKRQKKVLQKMDTKIRNKPVWKQADKDRQKKRKLEAAQNGTIIKRSRKELKLTQTLMINSKCNQRIAIDLSFVNESLMQAKDILKCINQVHRCYSTNRRIDNPTQLYMCSVTDKAEYFMSKHHGYTNWDVHLCDKFYMDMFEKTDVIYLTSDSDNIVTSLDASKVYVIGGLVDHNHHKGLCHKLAKENCVSHAKFPIDEFLSMKSRKVLAINHVFEILIKITEGQSWQDAFLSVIPSRKAAEIKNSVDKS